MLVEIIVKSAMQGHQRKGCRVERFDATASFARDICRDLLGKVRRRSLDTVLRESRCGAEKKSHQYESS
jgi:hypothetical protein